MQASFLNKTFDSYLIEVSFHNMTFLLIEVSFQKIFLSE